MQVIETTEEYKSLLEKYDKLLHQNEKMIEEHRREIFMQRKHETLLKEMGGLTKIGAWEIDIATRKVLWTDEVRVIHEVDESFEPSLEAGLNFYTPKSREKLQSAIEKSIETGEIFDFELEIIIRTGIKKQVRTIGRTDIEGGVVYGTFQDITEQKLIQDTQLFLINSRYLGDGETFFESLARFLSKSLDMEYVCIDRLTGDNLIAKTLAVYYYGKFDQNIEYTLRDTPCGDVVGKNIRFYPSGVRHLFPKDQALQEMSAESYAGTTLWSSDGKPIGLIAVISEKPMKDQHVAETILNLVSVRAAGELERSDVEYQLKLRKEELERQISVKDKFFSIIAHDLRSPFHAFLNLTETMAYDGEELTISEIMKLSKDLNNTATNLFNLLNNLLEWSKLQQGNISYTPENILLNDLIIQHVELMQERGRQKQIEILTELVSDVSVEGDRNMLNSVVLNLLSNALKFSNRGGNVLIKTELMSQDTIRVMVKDSGIGMPENILQNLFRIEVNVGRSGTDGEKSSGLGLLICKEFVEKHGGNLRVESKLGVGSTFFFTLKKTG